METTILKKVKGSTMVDIFNFSKTLNVRYYKALDLPEVQDYSPEKVYKFEINIRHSEGTDANDLFQKAIKEKH
jgi:hypothetical protein